MLGGIATGALGSAGLLGAGASLAQTVGYPQGFHRIEGPVSVNGLPADFTTIPGRGDRVTTGPGGFAVFAIDEDAFLVRENADALFPELAPSAAVRLFEVVAGMMLSVFGPGPVLITTPVATVGIRGSGCFVEARPETTYACVCYGHAEIRSNQAPASRETVRTRQHEQPRYIHTGTAGELIEPAPVINHTNEELILLESLFGREPPFGSTPGQYQ